ncbi:unnamed protein product [Somion occarium]|uniref:F-box domain-containing protein n=1 Tax=Somion occarium TaxID=3059160 RepID=A0ABP1DG53_9APHY
MQYSKLRAHGDRPSPQYAAVHTQDVVDCIVSCVYGDRGYNGGIEAVKACSLTCWTWYNASQRFILQRISIVCEEGASDFTRLLRKKPSTYAFITHLKISNRPPGSNKLLVDLKLPFRPTRSGQGMVFPRAAPWLSHLITDVIRLPRLRKLHLDGMITRNILNIPFVQVSKTLRKLKFQSSMVWSQDLHDIFLCFPYVERLVLLDSSFNITGTHSQHDRATTSPSIQALACAFTPRLGQASSLRRFISWLLSANITHDLRLLSVAVGGKEDLLQAATLCRSIGPQLQYFALSFAFYYLKDIIHISNFDLSNLVRLRTLQLFFPADSICAETCAILATISSDVFSHLELHLHILTERPVDVSHLSIISQCSFVCCLKTLLIIVRIGNALSNPEALFQTMKHDIEVSLSALHRKGIVRVSRTS